MREMMFRIGCSGWSYRSWVGPFYPKGTRPSDYLSLYSRVFDAVEIDSTFYAPPDHGTIRKWKDSTGDNFQFTAKLPKIITHERRLENVDLHLSHFVESITGLGEKLGMLLIQLPHSITFEAGFARLEKFLKLLPESIPFAVEFRNDSWFRDELYSLLLQHGVTLAWSEVPMTSSSTRTTSAFAYLRLVGDRSIRESQFGTVQVERIGVIERWAKELKEKENIIDHAFVFSNNHFQGFAPATANSFRKSAGLDPVDWETRFRGQPDKGQKTLLDW